MSDYQLLFDHFQKEMASLVCERISAWNKFLADVFYDEFHHPWNIREEDVNEFINTIRVIDSQELYNFYHEVLFYLEAYVDSEWRLFFKNEIAIFISNIPQECIDEYEHDMKKLFGDDYKLHVD